MLRPEGTVRKAVEGLRLSERFESLRLDSVFGSHGSTRNTAASSMSSSSTALSVSRGAAAASGRRAALELVSVGGGGRGTRRKKSRPERKGKFVEEEEEAKTVAEASPPSDRERDSSFNTFVNPSARAELGAKRNAERATLPPDWVEATDPNSGGEWTGVVLCIPITVVSLPFLAHRSRSILISHHISHPTYSALLLQQNIWRVDVDETNITNLLCDIIYV